MQGKQLKNSVTIRTKAFSQPIKDYIERQLKKDKEATVTGLILDLVEKGLTHSEMGGITSSPSATGIIINCPLRPLPIPYEKPFVTWKVPIDSTVCKTCPKYPCESWDIILSDKRLSDNETIKKTDLQQRIEEAHSLT